MTLKSENPKEISKTKRNIIRKSTSLWPKREKMIHVTSLCSFYSASIPSSNITAKTDHVNHPSLCTFLFFVITSIYKLSLLSHTIFFSLSLSK